MISAGVSADDVNIEEAMDLGENAAMENEDHESHINRKRKSNNVPKGKKFTKTPEGKSTGKKPSSKKPTAKKHSPSHCSSG